MAHPVTYAIADMHGNLPDVPIDCELLLIAGDICPDFRPYGKSEPWAVVDKGGTQQARWLETLFRDWIEALETRGVKVIATWGNHDFVGEKPFLVPRDLPWTLLKDEAICVEGVWVYGTPWVPGLPYWAFYGRDEALQARAEIIPDGMDVLMTHGPPYGLGDLVPWTPKYGAKYEMPPEGEHVGDKTLNEAIERSKPRTVICGHIHEAVGLYELGDTPIYNVAAVDEGYILRENPFRRLFLDLP